MSVCNVCFIWRHHVYKMLLAWARSFRAIVMTRSLPRRRIVFPMYWCILLCKSAGSGYLLWRHQYKMLLTWARSYRAIIMTRSLRIRLLFPMYWCTLLCKSACCGYLLWLHQYKMFPIAHCNIITGNQRKYFYCIWFIFTLIFYFTTYLTATTDHVNVTCGNPYWPFAIPFTCVLDRLQVAR